MGKGDQQVKGQMTLEEVQPKSTTPSATPAKAVKTVKPTAPVPTGTVSAGAPAATPTSAKTESLPAHPTEEEFKKASAKQREEHIAKKEAEFLDKQAAERARVEALKKKLKGEEPTASAPPVNDLEELDQESEEEYSASAIPERKKKRRICQKYKIKERQFKAAIEEARKIFVPKLGARLHPKLLVAIIELLEFGDI